MQITIEVTDAASAVNLTGPDTIGGVQTLQAAGLLTKTRAGEILGGCEV